MGYRGAGDLVQRPCETWTSGQQGPPSRLEVAKGTSFPEGPDHAFVILDSLDVARVIERKIAELLEVTDSEYHLRFVPMCKLRGVPLSTPM